jgi:pyroglutamyl-peptidase
LKDNSSQRVVLVTGFGGFPGARINPTISLVKSISASRRTVGRGIAVAAHVFRTSYAAVDADLPNLFQTHRPDAVLMFGVATRTPFLRIETRARNRKALLWPDAAGTSACESSIQMGGPASVRGRAPFQCVLRACRTARLPVRFSRDAGDYLCNYAYWRMLQRAPAGMPVLFVHVPKVRIGSRRRRKRPGITPPELARAAEAMLLAFVAASRR